MIDQPGQPPLPGQINTFGSISSIDAEPKKLEGGQAFAPVVPTVAPEAPTPRLHQQARPQVINGREVWAEHWGVSRAQLESLLMRLRGEPTWKRTNNMYTLVSDYVVPWTQGRGVGYALLLNQDQPREVNLMVSHAWSENAEEFLEVLCRTASDADVLFICAFSIFQAGDVSGPSIQAQIGRTAQESPFFRVLENLRRHGASNIVIRLFRVFHIVLGSSFVLACFFFSIPVIFYECIPFGRQCAMHQLVEANRYEYQWSGWTRDPFAENCFTFHVICLVTTALMWIITRKMVPYIPVGRMVVVPNRQDDIYGRLWCVYEIFVARTLGVPVVLAPTLASCGTCPSQHARCANVGDMRRIRAEIEQAHGGERGYALIDAAIYSTARETELKVAFFTLCSGLPQIILFIAFYRLYRPYSIDETMRLVRPYSVDSSDQVLMQLNIAFTISAGTSLSVGALFHMLQRTQGRPTRGQAYFVCWLLLSLSLVFSALSTVPGSAGSREVWQASQEMLAWFCAGVVALAELFWTWHHAKRPLYKDAVLLASTLVLVVLIYTAVRLNRRRGYADGRESTPTFCFSVVLFVYGGIGLMVATGSSCLYRLGLERLGRIVVKTLLVSIHGVACILALTHGDNWRNLYPWFVHYSLGLLCFVSFPTALCFRAIWFWGVTFKDVLETV